MVWFSTELRVNNWAARSRPSASSSPHQLVSPRVHQLAGNPPLLVPNSVSVWSEVILSRFDRTASLVKPFLKVAGRWGRLFGGGGAVTMATAAATATAATTFSRYRENIVMFCLMLCHFSILKCYHMGRVLIMVKLAILIIKLVYVSKLAIY